ncbi:MAG: alpha-amylase/4-alpha-glucanotransferase domain-containing protein [Calditrichaceae bacterium]
MKKVKFVLGIHNHQPIGNFDFVFEEAYQKSYLPFLQVLQRHPKIRISIHFTGILLDWLENHHPELLGMIKEMTRAGQLEVMSGGYYEPIISVIPPKDRKGQIQKLTRRVKDLFGYDATGMWMAERVWEPTLPTTLSEAGINYSVVDDTHFKYAGLTEDELTGYYITEDLGNKVFLFPISKHLRYTIPFQDPQATIAHLRDVATEDGDNVVVFADDGEKFGVWPETFRHVYENGWLEKFFTAVEQNMDWIEMLHFDEVFDKVKPKNKIFLPTASYSEMMHWSLFPKTFNEFEAFEHELKEKNLFDRYGIFVRGGFWRNFMTKYPEVNNMHKKMLRVSQKLWSAADKNQAKLSPAFDQLWAGQCNCPYWHGVFGGLYLSHLRHAIYNSLINAEKILDKIQPPDYPVLDVYDFDLDGQDEVLVETPVHNAYFKPAAGAVMFEYDYKHAAKNLLDTMTRRKEGYHYKLRDAKIVGESQSKGAEGTASIHDLVLAKEAGLEKYLNYDWYERKSFIDHFISFDSSINDFFSAKYDELGDFVIEPYALKNKVKNKDYVILVFERNGFVKFNDKPLNLILEKKLTIQNSGSEIIAEYKIKNPGKEKLSLNFGVEFNFGLQAGHADDRYYYLAGGKPDNPYLDSMVEISDIDFIGLKDEYMKIDVQLKSEKKAKIWRMPVETISLSEAGFERVYQSSSVVFLWKAEFSDEWSVKINHRVETI